MTAAVPEAGLVADQCVAGTKPVAVWAVLGCQDDPRAGSGADEIADSGHNARIKLCARRGLEKD
ncbi:hypothetical protein C8E89_1515 [Mycolicibacterium moriokaense]|uniref:Uncharacterized protein n=1 Tax=Mycolicibacterium moriokaense TaxID=39691 RepID=A0A318H1G8_9MYCO|nr:hypothetical protein C8E89_1515 [Mycolicibacterium moriokaense]